MEGGLGSSGVEETKLARQVGVESPFGIEGGREAARGEHPASAS